MNTWRIIGSKSGGSLDEHVVAHLLRLAYWLKMWRLIGSAPDN